MIHVLKIDADILGFFESRILKSQSFNINICLQNYVIEPTPTESNAGGVLLHINKKYSYETRFDLMIYKAKKLESTFIEVIMPKKTDLIVGCIFRYPCIQTYVHLMIITLILY